MTLFPRSTGNPVNSVLRPLETVQNEQIPVAKYTIQSKSCTSRPELYFNRPDYATDVRTLPHLLLADGSDEFLQIERLEVGYVLEVAGAVGCESGLQHR